MACCIACFRACPEGTAADFGPCLFRLWLAPPDGVALPECWRPAYRVVEAGTLRGGIAGQGYDDARRAFEVRQAADLGMLVG